MTTKDTAEYSASKAPETRKEAEERVSTKDWRLWPGGVMGSPTRQGMAGLERDTVPSDAADPDQTSYEDMPRSETR